MGIFFKGMLKLKSQTKLAHVRCKINRFRYCAKIAVTAEFGMPMQHNTNLLSSANFDALSTETNIECRFYSFQKY